MKALVLNGIGDRAQHLDRIGERIVQELRSLRWKTENLILRDIEIAPCMGCFGCWVQTPGVCLIDDAAREVTRKIIGSDLIVYLTPITFGGYSSELKKALDRSIGLISPFFTKINGEVHHRKRYAQAPKLLGVGVAHEPDEESARIFKTLIGRNAINMHNSADAACIVYEDQSATEIEEVVQAGLSELGVRS
ncbi:flavodoxin family protein [Candidatus Bipolaricaulota bacterium]|nr:flavodoxin family protein [Candidatus Bipolaricaulota bacterium]